MREIKMSTDMVYCIIIQAQNKHVNLDTKESGDALWVKLNNRNICRVNGLTTGVVTGIAFKKPYCTTEEWVKFSKETKQENYLNAGAFKGYKLIYDTHNINFYMEWFIKHLEAAINYNENR